jgi:hypothetical protein
MSGQAAGQSLVPAPGEVCSRTYALLPLYPNYTIGGAAVQVVGCVKCLAATQLLRPLTLPFQLHRVPAPGAFYSGGEGERVDWGRRTKGREADCYGWVRVRLGESKELRVWKVVGRGCSLHTYNLTP